MSEFEEIVEITVKFIKSQAVIALALGAVVAVVGSAGFIKGGKFEIGKTMMNSITSGIVGFEFIK